MKKFLLALAVAATAHLGVNAQNYTFSQTTGTYTDLTGGTVVSTPGWDEDQYQFPIGFNFVINGETFTDGFIDTYGSLYFVTSQTDFKFVTAYDVDLMDRDTTTSAAASQSPISYETTGTAGSRITKVQFKNAGFYDPSTSSPNYMPFPNDFVNFQIWIYEGSNKIEMHYGPRTITAGNEADIFWGGSGPSVGFTSDIDFSNPQSPTLNGFFLTGQAAQATLNTLTAATSYPALSSVPANGTIYTFQISGATGIVNSFDKANVSVFPNPVVNTLNIKGLTAKGNITIQVTDVLGKVVLTENVTAAQNVSVNVSNLKKGVYSVEIVSEEGRSMKQIIKQ